MVDDRRPARVFDVDQSPQGHSLAVGVADFQPADILDAHTERGVGLDVDLPVSIEERNVVHVQTPEIRLEREIHVVERYLLGLEFVAVDFHEELWLVHREAAEKSEQMRVRVALVGQVPHGPLQARRPAPR